MSASRRRRKSRAGCTRREFLRRGAGAAAALGLSACGGGGSSGGRAPEDGPAQTVFRHGVASGDPLADRVILWTRITHADGGTAVPVSLQIARDPQLAQELRTIETEALAARDWTVKLDVDGLAPGTTYYYRFSAMGRSSPIARTRTLPVGAVDRLRIAVLSCSSYAHGFFNAYQRVAEHADLDLVLHLGDYIYEYGNGGYGNARDYEPPFEIVTLEDYRSRYAYYRLEPELQELHRQHAMACIWDDHESANDSWRDGAENHQPDLEGDWSARKSAAQQAYAEWMPIRAPDPTRIFRRFALGDLVELLMLDTRLLARAQPLPAPIDLEPLPEVPPLLPDIPLKLFTATGPYLDPSRSLLGTEQEAWLIGRLRDTPARWKLVGQQVMFGQLKVLGVANGLGLSQYLNPDQWDGYPVARQRLFDALAGDDGTAAVNNLVVLTGDIHCAWAMDLTPDPNNLLPAAGGYNALTGAGSRAVEFVATSVTSPGLEAFAPLQDTLRLNNPHIKYLDLAAKGYLLLDITPERCRGEFWQVDTIATRSLGQHFGTAFETRDGENRLRSAERSQPRVDAPPLAPVG